MLVNGTLYGSDRNEFELLGATSYENLLALIAYICGVIPAFRTSTYTRQFLSGYQMLRCKYNYEHSVLNKNIRLKSNLK